MTLWLRSGCFLLAVLALPALSGCYSVVSPAGPIGGVYTNTTGPLAITGSASGTRVGRASASVVLGIATGDASIQAAMQAGGITRIQSVDYQSNLILGLFGTYTVVVYGE